MMILAIQKIPLYSAQYIPKQIVKQNFHDVNCRKVHSMSFFISREYIMNFPKT